jgi:uncharacterized membrane protein YcaP (DUF421 family)
MFLMRISGKRQVGELQLSEFVTAVMISELAVLPITSKDTPVLICYVPLITVVFIEVTISLICRKSVKIRRFFDGSPIVLVSKGKIIGNNLTKTRVSIDEIFTEIRLNGYKDISEIQYVLLEQNGKLSVIPKAQKNYVTASDLNLKTSNNEIGHCVIVEGFIDKNSLKALGKSEEWLKNRLRQKGITDTKNVLYFIIDDSGNENLVIKNKTDK